MVGEPGRQPAAEGALRRQPGGRAAVGIAGGDHQVGGVAAQHRQHGPQQPFVVLQIAVHDGDVFRLAGEDALQAGAGQAAPPDPAHAADAGIGRGDMLGHLGGAVGRIVVDDDELPVDAGKRGPQHVGQTRDVLPLVEGRNHDAELGCRARPFRWRRQALGIDSADAVRRSVQGGH